ncbi:MAG TPA: tRNA 2-thiouridine(34) synthase MnmA [Candidatus Saccharimonadales bacterium]|nr:tRNA 2-thiouridine(34) synthase MnmA [Candidatus Saccharimonadales bacterium]
MAGKKVYVGMSGGVDSSVTALLLKNRGFDVTGVFMKNWTQDFPGFKCPWEEDYQDAKRVAVELDIPFKVYDFETKYRHFVVDYMIDEYKSGRTPNPDIRCNEEVKFKLFLDTALKDGAEYIATGHYSRVVNGELRVAKDSNKDQSYFLYRISPKSLEYSLMPIGEYTKPEVRKIAAKYRLATADKKDSQGVCFVGNVNVKNFLQQFVTTKPGSIVDQNGKTIGEHDGALFYTIGQRHGLKIGGGLPYYVTGKNMRLNEVHVTNDISDKDLWHDQLNFGLAHWLNGPPKNAKNLSVRTRYRAPLVKLKSLEELDEGSWTAKLAEQIKALTPGQSAVIYEDDRVVGGGIVI